MATLAVLACIVLVCQTAVAYVSSGCCTRLSTSLNLFGDLFKNLGKKPRDKAPEAAPPAGAKVSGVRKNAKAAPLEKISNKQGRDWTAYAKDVEAAKPKEVNRDKQTESFNFKKADQFPNLYGGWIKEEGDQIAKQAIGAVKSAQGKVEFAEVLFDPVPNLDEVAFGTLYNKKLRKEVAASLKVPEYVTNRGGPATLEWSNLYWLNRLAAGLGGKRVLALSISGEGLSTKKPEAIPTLPICITLVALTQAKKDMASLGAFDVVVILSPCTKTHYDSAEKIGGKVGAKYHIALNSPYSANYDLGIGGKWELIYVMKRIPKGWIYRAWPKPYEAIVEGPDYEVFRAETFEKRPTLPEISKINMKASEEKYGATGNDRIFQNRL